MSAVAPGTATVEPFTGTAAEWDAFVDAHPAATHAHRFAWRRVIEHAFGHQCPYLCARGDDGALTGVLPLARVYGRWTGRFLVSLPFLNAGGPLGDAAVERRLVDAARALAARTRAHRLELRATRELEVGLAATHERVGCVLDLPAGGSDALWKSFPSKLRSQVRRPEKEGVEVRFGPAEREPFFHVFARNMRDLGTPTHPASWFHAVADGFGADAWFGCAYLRGEPVAGGCAIRFRDEVEMTWASSLRHANPVAPNMALYWAFLRRAADEGLARFDFGRCVPGGGTHRFKRQWGARDVPLPWYRHDGGRPAVAPPAEEGRARQWAQRAWSLLPLPVATALGPAVRRGIPA